MEKISKNQNSILVFIWRVCAAHVISYFIAGILAMFFLDYKTLYSSDSLSLLMKPVDSIWVMIGPSMQIFRGIIIALVLFPIRKFIFEKNGFIKLAWLILGLSFISTIGPTPGSFDGYIYTILPLQYHLLSIPEPIIYTLLFSGIITFWYKKEKPYISVIAVILVAIILFFGIFGAFQMSV